jgi:hypothetical protein
MPGTGELCIYCGSTDPSLFKGREHVVPQSFGKFGSATPVLDCVCDDCNAYFKRELDQPLARETLEGVGRYKRGKLSRESRPQRKLQFALGEGEETGEFAGAILQGVEPTTGNLMPVEVQLQVRNRNTGEYDMFFRRNLSTLVIEPEIYGELGARDWRVFAPSKAEHDEFVAELNARGIDFRPGAPFEYPVPHVREGEAPSVPVYVTGTVGVIEKRALLKVILNFAAKYLGQAEVLKLEWRSAFRFVRYGEGEVLARISEKPFWTGQETDEERFADDSINIRIENHPRGLLGVIQFYNLLTYEFLVIPEYAIPAATEFAARFTPGQLPMFGQRGRPSDRGS